MTRTVFYNWGPALAGLALVGLSACADHLPCNWTCTPEMQAAQEPLTVEPLRYAEIFGTEWVAGVSVEGKTVTEHLAKRADAASRDEGR